MKILAYFLRCFSFMWLLWSTYGVQAQGFLQRQSALSVCEGRYIQQTRLVKGQSFQCIFNAGAVYCLYLLEPDQEIENYRLVDESGAKPYAFISYNEREAYACYLLMPRETKTYSFRLQYKGQERASATLALYHQGDFMQAPRNGDALALPPGTVDVGEGLYMDATEVSNADYLAYLHWLRAAYGADSRRYRQALPDTLLWRNRLDYYEPMERMYFRHRAYGQFPLVGVTYAQAVNFCQWRSDRVNEQLYWQQNKQALRAGDSLGPAPEVLRYRLPTKEEWERCAAVGFSAQELAHSFKEGLPLGRFRTDSLYVNGRATLVQDNSSIPAPVNSLSPNRLGLYHMFGNVAEMVQEEGIAKGGSWCNVLETFAVRPDFIYKRPHVWLGFRCVCEYVRE